MGKAARLRHQRKLERRNIDDLIKEEHRKYPYLWSKTYNLTIKIPANNVFKRAGCPHFVIDLCGPLDMVCDSADVFGPGLSVRIREKFKE